MASILVTKKQFELVTRMTKNEETIQNLKEVWKQADSDQRIFALEFLKVCYPERKKQINEVIKKEKSNLIQEKWYNTVMDIVGWVDPSGIVDAVNGASYLYQGEYLFGFLSLVSAIPYAGDLVAKPVLHALKIGKPSAKALNGVMKLSKAGKTTEAAAELAKLTSQGGLVGAFVKGMGRIGSKLESLVKAMPGGALKGFKNTILQWIQLFKNAAKSGTVARQVGANLAKNMKRMTPAQQVKNLEAFKSALAATKGPFTGYRTAGKLFSWKSFWGGMPQLMNRNRSVRALMRQTKWYLGLLDFLGMGNFVGPDELQSQLGDAKFEESITEYNQTPEAQQYIQDDFGNQSIPTDQTAAAPPPVTTDASQQSSGSGLMGGLDPISWLLQSSLTTR